MLLHTYTNVQHMYIELCHTATTHTALLNVTRFPKCALFTHNFNVHFTPPHHGDNKSLTFHVCTVAKSLTVFFY